MLNTFLDEKSILYIYNVRPFDYKFRIDSGQKIHVIVLKTPVYYK